MTNGSRSAALAPPQAGWVVFGGVSESARDAKKLEHSRSVLVGRAAPYTGTMGARIEQLETGYARVTLRDRPIVRNHLRSVHAIALANLAELTGNVAVFYALPDDMRFIVAGLSIDYLKKARGTLTAESRPSVLPSSKDKREIEVVVDIRDDKGDLCAKATLRTLIGPKRG